MISTAKGMSHMIPNHVLRVGQTIHMDPAQGTPSQHPSLTDSSSHHEDDELDISLENLNQLILELDPTFEPITSNKSPPCISPPTGAFCSNRDISNCVLVPRGISSSSSPTVLPSMSPSIPIPAQSSLSCSPQGSLVFSTSPTSSLPPLPCGSVPRNLSPRSDFAFPQGSLRLSHSNRNSATSILSTSTCSDTSYILGSNLSLASDIDSPESMLSYTPGSFSEAYRMRESPDKPSMTKRGHLQEHHSNRAHSSPTSLSGSLTDIPILLINGAPQPDMCSQLPGREMNSNQLSPVSSPKPRCSDFQASLIVSQPSLKFVMDTSKFWFRPHISRAEAEALLMDKDAGTFVVRDSTSYKGNFGLAMKVDQSPTSVTASPYPGVTASDAIRHFLIESSPKGVRIKGSSQEPYFGSLSALVYQHTISVYALPCRLLLPSQDMGPAEERAKEKTASEEIKTACNFVYLNAVPTEMLTGPLAVQKAVTATIEKASGSFTPTIVNMKVSLKGVTLTDINRKLFFRRHYPAHLLSYSGEDPDKRVWKKGSSFGARMFGFVAKGIEAGMENMCHVFAEYDPLQPCGQVVQVIQAAIVKP